MENSESKNSIVKGASNMKKWIWIGIVVLIIAIMAGVLIPIMGGTAVDIAKVAKGEIKQYLEDTADVQSKEKQTVYSEGNGKITSVNFDVGDSVLEGDILLTLDKADLELQLKDANAKVDAAREQIKGTNYENYADKIEAAKASVEQAKIAYDTALRDYENNKILLSAGSISKNELDKSEDAYKTAKANLDAANAQLADIKRGTPSYQKNTYISQLEQALIFRDGILRNISKQIIKAPIDGIVLEKYIDVDSPLTAGTAVFLIGDVKRLELEANILADDSSKVKIGNEVEITGKPLGDIVLNGRVSKIAPSAKTITSTLGVNQKRVPVTIQFTNGQSILKPGYTVDIKIITADKKKTLIVLDGSVFDYKGRTCVLAVVNGKTVIRQVKTGLENDQFIEILEGLKEGDCVLLKPDNTIKEGMKVKGKER
ncbi:MAG: efflux RND transporter periplasmic adaptor subunit [Ignavibacteriales bacterium]